MMPIREQIQVLIDDKLRDHAEIAGRIERLERALQAGSVLRGPRGNELLHVVAGERHRLVLIDDDIAHLRAEAQKLAA